MDDALVADFNTAATTGDVLANDTDADGDGLTIDSFTQPTHGTVVDNGDGTFTYTPENDYSGADSFSYTAWHGSGGCRSRWALCLL